MPAPPADRRLEVALFRYRLVGDLVHLPPGSPELAAHLQERAAAAYAIPGSRRTRVALSTLRGWLRTLRAKGFEGLFPKVRGDRGSTRLPAAVAGRLLELKQARPQLSVRLVIERARASGQVPAGQKLADSTVYRLLKGAGLLEPPAAGAAADRRRFAFSAANQLWMSDVMHGPRVTPDGGDRRRAAKSYLAVLIDDATRVVPHAAFALSENTGSFLPVLRQAVMRRGLPQRLYVDNGAAYRSKTLAEICARLGVVLIHARPYMPQGKGKVERFIRRVRQQFLPLLPEGQRLSLAELNQRLWSWLETEYHETPHRGLDGETPHGRWAHVSQDVRYAEPELDLDRIFRERFERRVTRARTVSVQSRVYEVDAALVGEKVVLLRDPAAPASRPMPVEHKECAAGWATPLDAAANTRVRRAWQQAPPSEKSSAPRKKSSAPRKKRSAPRKQAPAAAPRQLPLRRLDPARPEKSAPAQQPETPDQENP